MWIKTTVAGATFLYQGDGGWGSGNTTFYLNNGATTGAKAGGVRWGGGWEEGSTTLNDGQWHFVALVANAGTKSLYVDGHADTVAANQWGATVGTGGQMWIGGSADTGDGDNTMTNGLIDEVYVFARALPLADIQLLTNNLISPNRQVLPPTTAVTLAATGATLDTGGFNQSIGALSGANGSGVLLAASTNANTLTVLNSSRTVFAGVISANGSLVKNGAGQLTLAAANTYGGATTVNAGTLGFGLSNNSNFAAGLQPQLWFSFDQVGGGVVTNQGTGGAALNGTIVGSNVSVVSGGRYGNALKVGSGSFSTSYVEVPNAVTLFNGATPGSAWTVALWVKTRTSGGAFLYQGAGSWAGGNTSFFLTSATQATSGAFSGGHVGGVRWGGGWMGGNLNVNDGNWHFIAITDNGGNKTIYVDGNTDTNYDSAQIWNLAATGNQLWIGGSADTGDGNAALNGLIDEVYVFGRAISKSEVQTIMNNQTLTNANNSGLLPATTSVSVAAGATLDLSGLSQVIASLANVGGAGGFVTNSAAARVALVLSNNNATATFNGVIGDAPAGPISLVKLGGYAQSLNGANNYSGPTTVGGGTLIVNGILGTNVVTVTNATLGGNGLIAGPVNVATNGTLTAGFNAVGRLTISNSLVLSGTTYLKVDAHLLTNDTITGVATVACGGKLSVTNLEGTLVAGDSFVLFSAANYTGAFAVANLPALSGGLYWNNQLAVNRTLSVVTNPPGAASVTLACQPNGTNLALNWPSAEIGWQLLVQTSNLVNGLSLNTNDWMLVPNSPGTNQISVPVDPAKPVEFYRLVAP
jgi:autotransporter-associated beta strand protein